MEIKGYIVATIEDYDSKQQEIAKKEDVEGKYAGGRTDDEGNTLPDIYLKDGTYFIPYEKGSDTITKNDIKTDQDV
jgi:hypothetical protein